MPTLKIAGILPNSLTNGKGLRKVFFAQGCKHHCPDCFNQHTWDFNAGKEIDCDLLVDQTINETYLAGVTFSGGDPLEQPVGFAYLASKLNAKFNIWCYTGYTFEQILERAKTDKAVEQLINNIDVLVDGKFDKKLMNESLKYVGSSNQRIIDVKKSLKNNAITLLNV